MRKHGALIDSRILAKVYRNMTSGQFTLALDNANTESNQSDPSLIKKVQENRALEPTEATWLEETRENTRKHETIRGQTEDRIRRAKTCKTAVWRS